MGFVLELDVTERDFLPLDVHPQDRFGKNDAALSSPLLLEEQGLKSLCVHQDSTYKGVRNPIPNRKPASTGFFKALSEK